MAVNYRLTKIALKEIDRIFLLMATGRVPTSGKMRVTRIPVENMDRKLGKLVQRFWAVIAFLASVASIGFGVVVIDLALFPGVILVLLGVLFFWLGTRAWRDTATLGELLNRDFQPAQETTSTRKNGN